MEVVNDKRKISARVELSEPLRSGREQFFTARVRVEVSERRQFGEDFHFCPGPTVTAGFIGFAFDIR